MEFKVSIDNFEGPLDLMLHLIKKQKLDLLDLDMEMLADQYIAYLETMQNLKLEIASEFLVELAALLEYKSKKLLPKEKIEIDEEYEENQLEKLRNRLIEYKQFKEVSKEFEELYNERAKMHDKPIEKVSEKWLQEVKIEEYEGDPYDLVKAMNRALKRYSLNHVKEVTLNVYEVNTEDQITWIKKKCDELPETFKLYDLCDECEHINVVIANFLAVLVLIKDGYLNFKVDKNDCIYLRRGSFDE